MASGILILNHEAIVKKITRMALEIKEHYYDEKELHILAVKGQGALLGKMISQQLKKNKFFSKIQFQEIEINKKEPWKTSFKEWKGNQFINKNVLIVDDVLNTGRTLWYLFHAFCGIPLKSLKVLVLVDRNHLSFPVKADITGLTLSTTLHHHIISSLEDSSNFSVYLR